MAALGPTGRGGNRWDEKRGQPQPKPLLGRIRGRWGWRGRAGTRGDMSPGRREANPARHPRRAPMRVGRAGGGARPSNRSAGSRLIEREDGRGDRRFKPRGRPVSSVEDRPGYGMVPAATSSRPGAWERAQTRAGLVPRRPARPTEGPTWCRNRGRRRPDGRPRKNAVFHSGAKKPLGDSYYWRGPFLKAGRGLGAAQGRQARGQGGGGWWVKRRHCPGVTSKLGSLCSRPP